MSMALSKPSAVFLRCVIYMSHVRAVEHRQLHTLYRDAHYGAAKELYTYANACYEQSQTRLYENQHDAMVLVSPGSLGSEFGYHEKPMLVMVKKGVNRGDKCMISTSRNITSYNFINRCTNRNTSNGISCNKSTNRISNTNYSNANYSDNESNDANKSNDINKDDQQKKANLGSTVELLRQLVPDILHQSLPKELLSHDVLLRVLPTHFADVSSYLSPLKGHVSYYATAKAIQLYINNLVANPHVKLHILSVRTTASSDIQCVYPESQKIIVRWITCNSECDHLETRKTYANTRSYKFNPSNVADFIHNNDVTDGTPREQPKKLNLLTISATLANVTQGLLTGLGRPGSGSDTVETVLSGIFVFELNEDNTQIVVHTIEDVDVIERYDEVEDPLGGRLAC